MGIAVSNFTNCIERELDNGDALCPCALHLLIVTHPADRCQNRAISRRRSEPSARYSLETAEVHILVCPRSVQALDRG